MPLTLRYSLQESLLKPKNVEDEYAKLQVDYRPEQSKITLTNEDYQELVQALAEGRLIGIENADGVRLGQFMSSISGGVVVKNFTTPNKEEIGISFRPSPHFLNSVRKIVSFERMPTVKRTPIISGFTFTDSVGKTVNREIPISTGGFLKITGINFVKSGMQVLITQQSTGASVILNTQINSGMKYINILINSIDIDPTNDFSKGRAVLTVFKQDKAQRRGEYLFEIV